MKELMSQHVFQLRHLFADSALGQMELFGRSRETQVTSRRFEALKGCHGRSKAFVHIALYRMKNQHH
jgi:hypothetical protein